MITSADGVDPNRNFPQNWNYDDEGSASITADQTYRGPAAASEPETQAMIGLYDRADFNFHVNYHSFRELLLYTFGHQVNTRRPTTPLRGAVRHRRQAGHRRLQPRRGRRPVHHQRRDHRLRPRHGQGAGVDAGAGRWAPRRRLRVPGQGGQCPARVLEEPALRAGRPIGARPGRPGLAHQHRRRALLPERRRHRPPEELEPDERLRFAHSYNGADQPVQVLAKRPRRRRHRRPRLAQLLDQRRPDAQCRHRRVGGRRPLRRRGRPLLPHRPRIGDRCQRRRHGEGVVHGRGSPATRSPSRS